LQSRQAFACYDKDADSAPYSWESGAKLEIEGIVVREHPVVEDGVVQHYDVAIFFNSLTRAGERYIDKVY